MPIIYFDNFRGFDSTFLPLTDVNFFVGENSTGKTSVLKLIKLLSDQKFWFSLDFRHPESDLGFFAEIASYRNREKKYFEIGIMADTSQQEDRIIALKLRFVEKDGIAIPSQLHLIDNSISIEVIIDEQLYTYRYEESRVPKLEADNSLKFFKEWISNESLKHKAYSKIKTREDNFFSYGTVFLDLQYIIYEQIKEKNSDRFRGIRLPSFLSDVAWLAPIRTEPKRTYDSYKTTFSPDGTHAPYLLKSLLKSTKDSDNITRIIKKFGEDSGLFKNVEVKMLGESLTDPFEIHIYLDENTPQRITDVGYGVSQILPLIVEVIARPIGSWFAIQQPEIHLHPKGQAAFGDFILKSHVVEKKCFIIETHSDFTIDRFRLKMNRLKDEVKKPKSQVVFFTRKSGGNSLVQIHIEPTGSYPEDVPSEFRDFFVNEQLDLLSF